MLKAHNQFFKLLFQVSDAIMVLAAWCFSYWMRFESGWSFIPPPSLMVPFTEYLPLGIAVVAIWFISLQASGAYKSWRIEDVGKEVFSLFKATLLAFLVSITIIYFIAREDFSRIVMGTFLGLSFFSLVIERVVLRHILRNLRKKGYNQRYLVFVGDETLALKTQNKMAARPELGLQIRGIFPVSEAVGNLKNLGALADLDAYLKASDIDQLVICLKNKDTHLLDQLLKTASENNVQVRIIPDIAHYSVIGFELEDFDGLPIISINESPLNGWNSIIKRLTDVIYASAALLLFFIPMVIISVLIKLSSRGPVLYSQERMGLDGRKFRMYKFRSMRPDAEDRSGPVWTRAEDSRVTWIGRILRKTSLDELPQLFNVLLGHMSCVGPRPERPFFVDEFRKQVPGYMLRHKTKAGMTGWAQVNGLRGDTSLEDRIEFDLYYITNWSLFFDFRIMFLTLFKGFITPNAY